MWIPGLLSFLALVVLCQSQTIIQQVCTADRHMTAIQPGADVVIGGLFDIRSSGTNGSGCGRPLSDTMQIFEAARYAVNYLNTYNAGKGYISGVKFGMEAYDTCFSSGSALNSLQKIYPQTTSNNPFCTSSNRVIAGVLGSLSSVTAIPASAMAGQLPVSIISPSATAPELSDKFRYPTSLRTVPSYAVFAKVMVELFQKLQWQNILVIYTDDVFGRAGYEQLLLAMYNRGLCVSQALALDRNDNKDSYKIALSTIGNMSSSVAVLMTPNSLTKPVLQAVDETPALAAIQWVLGDIDITNDVSNIKSIRGAMVVVPRSATVDEFTGYFAQLEASPRNNVGNPWFEDWFEETYKCSFASSNCSPRTAARVIQSPWAVPTMKAVFAYAEAVNTVCRGTGSGLCSRLTTMNSTEFNSILFGLNFTLPTDFPKGLSGLRVKFNANGDPEMSDFTVYNYNNRQGSYEFEEIGHFESNTFTLTKQPSLYDSTRNTILTTNPTATCVNLGCENCLLPRRSVPYQYKSGDLVIASLINAHEPGQAPYTCGTGRVSQLAALVAAEWAVSRYKVNNPGQLQQVNLGSLVADVCPDAAVAQGFLTDLLSGNNKLVDLSGAIIPYNNIWAFVDETSSDQAEIIGPIISQYQIPEVLTSVTTSRLAHGGSTPYFTRVVPSDDVIYSAISSLLQRLGWKYVQVATHKSGEYMEMAETFTRVAVRYGICVVDMTAYFSDGMADPYNRTVTRLLSNHETQIVVVFGSMMSVQGLLGAIGQRGVSSQLQLIAGTDSWGSNPAYIQGVEIGAAGAIVFDLELAANTEFSTYLQGLTLTQITANPFLRELLEITNQCAINPASQGMYTRICGSTDTFKNFYQGKVPYIIQTINAVANKLHEVISEVCGPAYSGLCPGFRSITDFGSHLSAKLADIAKGVNGFGTKNGESTTNINFSVYNQSWQKFAEFNTEGKTLISVNTGLLGSYQNKLAICSGVCMECQYMFTMKTSIFYNMGNWLIAGSFGVSNSGPEKLQPYICGDVKTANGPQFTMAMLYALQQVNSGKFPNSVRGIKFSGLILDHCDNPGRADLIVSDIYAGFMNKTDIDQRKIIAWITDTDRSANETVQILDPLNVATVSPSATADSLMKYQTFFRTVQGDASAAAALVSIVKAMRFNYAQVVYSADSYGREGVRLLMAAAQAEGICITSQLEYSLNSRDVVIQVLAVQTKVVILFASEAETDAVLSYVANNSFAASTLLILMPKPYRKILQRVGSQLKIPVIALELQLFTLSDYNAYINSAPLSNPYFAEYYMKIKGCNVPGYSYYSTPCAMPLKNITDDVNYQEDVSVLSTIDAVYSVVNALHLTVIEYCGSNYAKPCSNFLAAIDKRQRFIRNLNNVNFVDDGKRTFRFLAREGATLYNILQSTSDGRYMGVGNYTGQSLDLMDAAVSKYGGIVSACTAPCLGCIMKGLNFSYTEGDVYLAGIFDVHERSLSPFTCGEIKTLHGFLLLEAFHYAIDQVNAKQGQFANILPGTRLGGIGLDACRSAVRAGYIISNVHSGLVTLAKESTIIYPSSIDAYIGMYDSTSSMYIARILTDLEIPQISFGAGSQELSDQRIYPYFYRTVPTDDNLVEAMLKLMNNTNIRYVQILYEDNSNGISAMKHFVERAGNYSICVAEAVPYPDLGIVSVEISTAVVAKLTEKPTANTVATFLSTQYINSVLRTMGSSVKAKNMFRFVGSSSWADNQDALLGTGSQAVGSITTRLDADDVEAFDKYINSKNLANSKTNPWFEEYFQRILNCYISKTNTMGYPAPCPANQVNLISSTRYQQDSDVVYVINAVYAAAFAMDKTLKALCGANYTTVCQAYRANSNRHALIRNNLADVTFADPVNKTFMFVNRSGVASYRFNSIISGPVGGDPLYQPIGSYNVTTDMVSIISTYTSTWSSDCNRPDACAECPAIRDRGLRYVFHNSSQPTGTTIVAFFDIHKQGVDPFRCGEINIAGFQQFLTFFYTLEKLVPNNNYKKLAIDTCSNSLRVDQDLYGLLDGTGLCNTGFNNANPVSVANISTVITVGEQNTVAASRVLELPKITYISPNALSTQLDETKYLVRTIAPISAMMKTMVSLLRKLGWTFVDVVYEESEEGVDSFQSFASYANSAKVCRGSNLKVVSGSTSADVENLLARLNGNRGSKAVILLGSYNSVKLVLTAANAMSIVDKYVWILGGEWDLTNDALKELVPTNVEVRFITVRRLVYSVGNFKRYWNELTYSRVHGTSDLSIPQEWFDEFYQQVFDCTISSAVKPINIGKRICNTTMQLSSLNLTQDMYILNTIAATFAAVAGLNNCGGACPVPFNDSTRTNILKNIVNVQWPISVTNLDLDPNTPPVLKFDNVTRWWDSAYFLKYLHVRKLADGTLEFNKNEELTRGDFNPDDAQIANMKSIIKVTSVCTEADACSCTYEAIEKPQPQITQPFKPSEPRNYYYYHNNGERQYDWPIWAIVIAVLTSVGLLAGVILFLILIFAYPNKGGTSVLGYMTIIGILGIYAINFAFFVHAKDATCGARRFLMGVVYMIAIAPLMIKAIDNWRYGRYGSEKERYSGISSSLVLFLVAVAVVLIQCIIPIMWLILVHPTASKWTPYAYALHDNWWCDPPELYDTGLVQSFIFVMFIVLVTAVFSALCFDSDRNNFESRWILFSCIATAGCFLVWMIVSTSAGASVRDPAVAIGNLVNATLLLLALPLRKSVLLCKYKRDQELEEDTREVLNNGKAGHLDMYNEAYGNPMFELHGYDNQYGAKPSEY